MNCAMRATIDNTMDSFWKYVLCYVRKIVKIWHMSGKRTRIVHNFGAINSACAVAWPADRTVDR